MSDYIPVEIRRRVRAHFSHCCAYCRSSEALTVVTFEVEHILPLSRVGPTEFENLGLACPTCNRHKSNRVAGITDEGLESRLFHPHSDRWLDHFDWSISGLVIVGLTDVGTPTIKLLRMNRPQLVEVRSLWVTVGKHPPK